MKTFSVNNDMDDGYAIRVADTIEALKPYFVFWNKYKTDEAMHRAYITALKNRNDQYKDLVPYIKILAKFVMRVPDKEDAHESPYDLYDESGEVAYTFTRLTSCDSVEIADKNEIRTELRDMYLECPTEFEKLRALFKADVPKDLSGLRIKNDMLLTGFSRLLRTYSGGLVYSSIYDLFVELAKEKKSKVELNGVKEIEMKQANFKFLNKISFEPQIISTKGEMGYIDRITLESSFDPDIVNWDTLSKTSCNILKIDISSLINYMFENICVEKAVNTPFVKWMGDRYKLMTCGGYIGLNEDKYAFMDKIHREVVLNIVMNNINKVIAVSSDSIYVKPTRAITYSTIRVKLVNGKSFDLPVTVHKQNG